ncbi:MAG: hypothetical protein M3Z41_05905 [Candidatus Eremiobacteraeota bacterium]|nr:hypothetical protein [Candidatus Eremiobacteraeota bacterium]
MTPQQRRPVPADMLLIEERRRRLRGDAPADAAQFSSTVQAADEEIFVSDDDQLIADEDQQIEGGLLGEQAAADAASGDVLLRRPIAQVSLVQISWSGPIDHSALANALVCYPVGSPGRSEPALFDAPPFSVADGGAALEVTLRPSDLALLRGLVSKAARLNADDLVRAARLPERLTGAELATRQAVSPVLGAYRRSALAYAWHRQLRATDSTQLHRERDEAAVAVLSTVRALIGER